MLEKWLIETLQNPDSLCAAFVQALFAVYSAAKIVSCSRNPFLGLEGFLWSRIQFGLQGSGVGSHMAAGAEGVGFGPDRHEQACISHPSSRLAHAPKP